MWAESLKFYLSILSQLLKGGVLLRSINWDTSQCIDRPVQEIATQLIEDNDNGY